jgi:hypothetical protein
MGALDIMHCQRQTRNLTSPINKNELINKSMDGNNIIVENLK